MVAEVGLCWQRARLARRQLPLALAHARRRQHGFELGLGVDCQLARRLQPQVAIDAIFYSYTVLNGAWLLLYAIVLLKFPIRDKALVRVVAGVNLRRSQLQKVFVKTPAATGT